MTSFPGREALQPERTALAWQRTAVTALVLVVPMVVVAVRTRLFVLAGLGGAAGVVGWMLVVVVHRRFAELRDDDRGYSPLLPIAGVAAVTALGAIGGVALGLAVWLR